MSRGTFGEFVASAHRRGELIVQPRMGFGRIEQMQAGLRAVKAARARTIGTITLDSYTRVGDHASARAALRSGQDLNGFPLVVHGAANTREMLAPIMDHEFPVQVRHGSSRPYEIFRTLIDAGIGATEGGPVSYCLPYSRTPLAEAIVEWSRCCDLLAQEAENGNFVHLESFGGCLLGQLCPPSLLVTISILEAIFFERRGVPSISLSYAQQTSFEQDSEALQALCCLGTEYLKTVDWHLVLYTYMGLFPRTARGALDVLTSSVRLATRCNIPRLIVKTAVEAHRIPSVEDNVEALEHAASAGDEARCLQAPVRGADSGIAEEARALIENVLSLDADLGRALVKAFARGYLDVPYCLHADNAGRARSFIDSRGWLQWSQVGAMPITLLSSDIQTVHRLSARTFLKTLSFVERHFDSPYLPATAEAEHAADITGRRIT